MVMQLVGAGAILAVVAGTVLAVVVAAAALAPPRAVPPAAAAARRAGAPGPLPPNAVEVHGQVYLRVLMSPGATALHLAARVDDPASPGGRPAVVPGLPGVVATASGYARDPLRRPVWTTRTLCGVPWSAMADHAAETAAMIAHAGPAGREGYVCAVCAARVEPGRPLRR
jgi:hypothetical protein